MKIKILNVQLLYNHYTLMSHNQVGANTEQKEHDLNFNHGGTEQENLQRR